MAVDRDYILNKMKGRTMSPDDFNFEMLQAPPLYSLLTPNDIAQLHKLATSFRYAAKPLERMQGIDNILRARGFRKLTGGTNRVVYSFLENDSIVLKVATDNVGVKDNPREFINQMYYKPFVTKVFEVSPCGTVGLFERVIPITSREEFLSVAPDVFDVISNWFIGEYVMDDIGSNYFLNWGIRKGFGPVLLDFPYSYKLDGNKLYCNAPLSNDPTQVCGGVIDYDDGFNTLRCTKCGVKYKALELKKAVENKTVIQKGGKTNMKVSYGYGKDTRVIVDDASKYMDHAPKLVGKKKGKKAKIGTLKTKGCVDPEVKKPTIKAKGITVQTEESVVEKKPWEAPVLQELTPIPVEEDLKLQHKEDLYETGEKEVVSSYEVFDGEITNVADLVEECNNKYKCIALKFSDGEYVKIGSENGGYAIIKNIDGIPVSELSILKTEALQELYDKISSLQNKNTALELEVNDLQSKLDRNDDKDDNDDKPWFLDNKGRKRDKKNGRFYSDNKDGSNESFDTSSPLIKEDDVEEVDIPTEATVDATNVPVGAAPPKNFGTKNRQRSAKKDPNHYKKVSGK